MKNNYFKYYSIEEQFLYSAFCIIILILNSNSFQFILILTIYFIYV